MAASLFHRLQTQILQQEIFVVRTVQFPQSIATNAVRTYIQTSQSPKGHASQLEAMFHTPSIGHQIRTV